MDAPKDQEQPNAPMFFMIGELDATEPTPHESVRHRSQLLQQAIEDEQDSLRRDITGDNGVVTLHGTSMLVNGVPLHITDGSDRIADNPFTGMTETDDRASKNPPEFELLVPRVNPLPSAEEHDGDEVDVSDLPFYLEEEGTTPARSVSDTTRSSHKNGSGQNDDDQPQEVHLTLSRAVTDLMEIRLDTEGAPNPLYFERSLSTSLDSVTSSDKQKQVQRYTRHRRIFSEIGDDPVRQLMSPSTTSMALEGGVASIDTVCSCPTAPKHARVFSRHAPLTMPTAASSPASSVHEGETGIGVASVFDTMDKRLGKA